MPPAAFGGRLARILLRILLVDRGRVVPRGVLVDALWADHPPADPDANLNVLANRARRALGDPSLIVTRDGGYALADVTTCTIDAEVFCDQVVAASRARSGGHHAIAARVCDDALRGYAEPLPEDAYADWAHSYRSRLEHAYEQALTIRIEAALALGDHPSARTHARALVASQPLSEPAHLLLVRSLAASGDAVAALEALTAWQERLADELGLDPSPAADDLRLRLLRGQPLPGPSGTSSAGGPTDGPAFVGRDRELASIRAAIATPGGTVVVLGGPGAGKSRLLAEAWATVDAPVLVVRGYEPERGQPWSVAAHLLRAVAAVDPTSLASLPPRLTDALSGIVPELVDGSASGLEPQTEHALVLAGMSRLLGRVAEGGAIIACDDLQWVDASSLELIASARRRPGDLRLVVAARASGGRTDGAVSAFLEDLPGDTVTVHLAALDAAATGHLVDDPEVATILAERTDGSPLAIGEVLRALERNDHAAPTGDGRWRIRPGGTDAAVTAAEHGQRRAIARRVRLQPATARELMALLALAARPVPLQLLTDATGVAAAAVLDDLTALALADLVRVSDQGWSTAHDLIAEVVADQLTRPTAAAVHGRLAMALTAAGADGSEVARHHAGAGDPQRAAAAYAHGAIERLGCGASDEARQLADAGLALDATAATRADLLRSRGIARANGGDLVGASRDLRAALETAPTGPARAPILARMTLLATAEEDLQRARELAETALLEAGDDPSARMAALIAAAGVDMNTGHGRRAAARSAEAERLATTLGDAHGVAEIVDTRAMTTFLDGDITAAAAAFDQAARLFSDTGDLLRVITPRSTRGHALLFAGDPHGALTDTGLALDLAFELGNPEGEIYARWHRSEAWSALGRPDEAADDAMRALALARRIEHRGWTSMALRACGIAAMAAGDPTAATTHFAESRAAGRGVDLFTSWADARLGGVLVQLGDLRGAATATRDALASAPPLAGYEARLAAAELATARGDSDAGNVAARALELARRGGHLASAARLTELAGAIPLPER